MGEQLTVPSWVLEFPDFSEYKPKELRPGAKVKIVCSWPSHSGGWNNVWVSEMDRRVRDGKEYTVSYIRDTGVYLAGAPCGWPPQSLEVVG